MSAQQEKASWPNHPFAKAVQRKDARGAMRIAKKDPSVVDLKLPCVYGWETPLHAAVRLKSLPLTELMLDMGIPVDAPNEEGYTPLFLAPELYSRVSIVELLVERGADLKADNGDALWSAIWQASYRYGNTMPMVHFLVEQGCKPRGLHHAAEAGNLKVAQIVTDYGADVNERDDGGFTPLDYCTGIKHSWQFKTGQNRPRVAAYLREHGARNSADL